MLADDKIVEYMYHMKKIEDNQRRTDSEIFNIIFWTSLREAEEEHLLQKSIHLQN
jgi:hypothetical protein